MFESLTPKQDEIHWFNKSPEKQKSIEEEGSLLLLIQVFIVSFRILVSAFSQVSSPQNSFSKHLSK